TVPSQRRTRLERLPRRQALGETRAEIEEHLRGAARRTRQVDLEQEGHVPRWRDARQERKREDDGEDGGRQQGPKAGPHVDRRARAARARPRGGLVRNYRAGGTRPRIDLLAPTHIVLNTQLPLPAHPLGRGKPAVSRGVSVCPSR